MLQLKYIIKEIINAIMRSWNESEESEENMNIDINLQRILNSFIKSNKSLLQNLTFVCTFEIYEQSSLGLTNIFVFSERFV